MTAAEQGEFVARIRREVETLSAEFEGIFAIETIQRVADDCLERFRGARIAEFVPLLVYRFTRERLHAQAQSGGLMAKSVPEILYVCVHNAIRRVDARR